MVAKTADEARQQALSKPSAYQPTNANPIGPNQYTDKDNIYSKLIFSSGDAYQKASLFQELYRGLVVQPSPTGAGNLADYMQTLLRSTGFSKGKTAIGIFDPKDIDGLIQAIGGAIGVNAPDPIQYLQSIAAFGGRGAGKVIKQPDATTKFTRQVTSALQFKDYGDAKRALTDAFMTTYNELPNEETIVAFQNAWNAEVRSQAKSTATEGKTQMAKVYDKTSEPVMDKKTGKQKVDKFGQLVFSAQKKNKEGVLQYKPITTSRTETLGEGFTAEEQAEFMSDYLVANFPDIKDAENLGGAAKVIYDNVVSLAKNNFQEIPNFAQVAPIIKDVIGSGKPEVAQEYLRKYQDSVRSNVSKKYMSIADDIKQGKNATEITKPIIDSVSAAFEESIDINDPFMKMVLNYQAKDGTYRLPNEFEMSNLLMSDSRSKKTSAAIQNGINVVKTLQSKLQVRG